VWQKNAGAYDSLRVWQFRISERLLSSPAEQRFREDDDGVVSHMSDPSIANSPEKPIASPILCQHWDISL
jgi:hypothetical protein